jgi:hypothetical protein
MSPTMPVQIVILVSNPQVLNANDALPKCAAVLLGVTHSGTLASPDELGDGSVAVLVADRPHPRRGEHHQREDGDRVRHREETGRAGHPGLCGANRSVHALTLGAAAGRRRFP